MSCFLVYSLNDTNIKKISCPELWKWTPLFRCSRQLAALERFLVPDVTKDHVLQCFATGFISHFEYDPPPPWGHVTNYDPIKDSAGARFLRQRMKSEVLADDWWSGVDG